MWCNSFCDKLLGLCGLKNLFKNVKMIFVYWLKGEYMKKLIILCAFVCLCSMSISSTAQAGYLDVLNAINATGNTINTINRTSKGTMSTIEYSQRFTDRQQDRKDRKAAEKEYNDDAEAEYYRTLQETQQLQQRQYYNNQL